MTSAVVGAGLGVVASGGLLLAIAASPPARRGRLDDRLAPYVRDTPRASRLLSSGVRLTRFPDVDRVLGPVLGSLAGRIDRALGGAASVRRRLEQAGGEMTVEQFRVEQLVWGAGGLLGGLLVCALVTVRGSTVNPVVWLVLAAVTTVAAVLGRDRKLSHAVRQREAEILGEFPTIAELLALAVAAGESPVGALERVARLSRGELSREFARALADVRAGTPAVEALEQLAARTSAPVLGRFVEGMAIALERGTPLAEVLRAQAADVREASRRALLEAGGRKEIAMLVPVVFLILPVTVVFALFPGFFSLQLAVP